MSQMEVKDRRLARQADNLQIAMCEDLSKKVKAVAGASTQYAALAQTYFNRCEVNLCWAGGVVA